MLVKYHPSDSKSFYEEYYRVQTGSGLGVYRGRRVIKGGGLGSMFSGLLRTVAPLAKKAAMSLGKRALSSVADIASDTLDGQNIGASIRRRAKAAGEDILSDAVMAYKSKDRAPKRKSAKPGGGKAAKRKRSKNASIF
jgi:hypothetical protein